MVGVALKGLLGRKLRATLTGFAIVLGVAMISGAFILTDTLSNTYDGIYGKSYKSADAVISSKVAIKTNNGDSEAPAFSAAVLEKVESLPGVAHAQGTIEDASRLTNKDGRAIGKTRDGVAIGVAHDADQSLNPLQLVDGAWPQGDAEIAIDKGTAENEHYAIGQTVGSFGDGPLSHYTISGIVQFGTTSSIGSTTITVYDLPTAQRIFDKLGKFDRIRISARDGVTEAALIAQIQPLLSETTKVQTAADQAHEDSADDQAGLNFLKYFLLGFGGIALFVGSFVIANTLAITVAQRMREFATLRTLGASRHQVLGSVVLESLVIGLIGSTIGLFLGFAIALGLLGVLALSGVELPNSSLVLSLRTVFVSLGVGTFISLLASLRPAFRATRVEPIAAVREGAVLPPSKLARYALPASAAIGITAIGLFSYGLFVPDVDILVRIVVLVVGVLLMFVAVATVASRIVRPLAYVLGAPGARFGGTAGSLARQNAIRNPSRTASTAAAVMIGLALITFVAVIGEGFQKSFVSAVDEQFVADYSLSAGNNGDLLTDKAAQAAAQAPGVLVVSGIRSGDAKANGKSVLVTGVDANVSKVVKINWKNGSDSVPGQLGSGGAFVDKRYADDESLKVGSALAMKTPTGQAFTVHVKGIVDTPKGGGPFGQISVSTATFDRSFANHDNDLTLINMRGGQSAANTRRIERSLTAFPAAIVETREEFKATRTGELKTTLKILYALLGLSVIVSLFGVINTLVLSVFERTRELGMLRAIGMTRRQVRRMIRYESIVTALIGATLGIGVGIFLAALTTTALSKYGIVFAVPTKTIAIFVIVAILAGMLAAILPAKRASRLNILKALQYE